jgi:hypothetical protein
MSEEDLTGEILLQLTAMSCCLEPENTQSELNQAIRAYLKLKEHLQRARGEAFNPKPDVGRTYQSSPSALFLYSSPTQTLPSSTRVG